QGTAPGRSARPGAVWMDLRVSVAARPAAVAAARPLAILRFVDFEGPTVEVGAVQRLHGARGVGIRHLHEAEAARPTRVAIGDQGDLLDRSVFGKQGADGLVGRGEGEISDIQLGHLQSTHERIEKHRQVSPASWFVKLYEGER